MTGSDPDALETEELLRPELVDSSGRSEAEAQAERPVSGDGDSASPGERDAQQTPWRMLHPASLAVNLLPRTWAVVRQAWPLLAVLLLRGQADSAGMFELVLLLSFFVTAVGNTFVHFLMLRYRIHDGRLEIRSGLLHRQARVISPRKVQNVEMVRNVFHRLAGLAEVRIETASGTEVEGMLSALTVEDAEALIAALSTARGGTLPSDVGQDAPPVLANSVEQLLWFGATATRVGATLVATGIGLEAVTSMDPELAARTGVSLGWWGIGVAVVTILAVAWLLGTTGAVVRHYGFRLDSDGERLSAREGLLTRRHVELPIHKVQVVTLREPWLRRWLGFGSVVVETAAARAGAGGVERALSMVPYVAREDVTRVVESALPDIDINLDTAELARPNTRARTRGMIRGALQGSLMAGVFTWWWWPMGLLSWLLVPMLVILQWLDWKHQGWIISDRVVVSRRGYLSRTTRIVARDKLQSVEIEQGPLLRRYRLGGVWLRVAGSGVGMPLLDYQRGLAMAARLSETTRGPLRARVSGTVREVGGGTVLHHENVQEHEDASGPEQERERPGIRRDQEPGDEQHDPAAAGGADEVGRGAEGVSQADGHEQDTRRHQG